MTSTSPKTPSDEWVAQQLRRAHLKITPTRREVFRCFRQDLELKTIDEILKCINRRTRKRHDWVTVYRCLKKFERAGIINCVDLGDGLSRYEWARTRKHHHHVVCKKCRSVRVIDECTVHELHAGLRKMGYTQLRHQLLLFGVCSDCRSRSRSSARLRNSPKKGCSLVC